VIRALRLGDDELPADQLDGLAAEHPEAHEPLVLGSLPPPERQWGLRHGVCRPVSGCGSTRDAMGRSVTGRHGTVNVPGRIRRGAAGAPIATALLPGAIASISRLA